MDTEGSVEVERIRTPEQIAAARQAYADAKAAGMDTKSLEFKTLRMKYAASCRVRHKPGTMARMKRHAMRSEVFARQTDATLGKIIDAIDHIPNARALILKYLSLNDLSFAHLYECLDAKECPNRDPNHVHCVGSATKKWAVDKQTNMVALMFKMQQSKEPARQEKPRGVVVRGWPSEGIKT